MSEVRQGQDRIGLRCAAGFPFLVRKRVRIPAQVPAEPQLQAPRGDPVPLDSFWRACLGAQRGLRRLQQPGSIRILRSRVPPAAQQSQARDVALSPGERLPGEVARWHPGPPL